MILNWSGILSLLCWEWNLGPCMLGRWTTTAYLPGQTMLSFRDKMNLMLYQNFDSLRNRKEVKKIRVEHIWSMCKTSSN